MKRYLITLVLLVIGGWLLVRIGLIQALVPWLTPPQAWQVERAREATPDTLAPDDHRLERLQAENLMLRRRLHDYEAVAVGAGLHPGRVVLTRARVLGRSGRAADRYIEIDAGRHHGVEAGMAVTSGWTLLGVVVLVRGDAAVVRLLTDHASRVPAHLVVAPEGGLEPLVPGPDADAPPAVDEEAAGPGGETSAADRSEAGSGSGTAAGAVTVDEDDLGILALGVAAGTGARDSFELHFVEDRPGLELRPGQVVISAGGPGSVPPGILIGTVREASLTPESDHWRILVDPAQRGDRVAEVLVLRAPTAAASAILDEQR